MAVPGVRINTPSVPNLRDLGGYATAAGGRMRMGRLYRSVEFNHLAGDDLDTFAALGIRTVFDFRTELERQAQPDVVPEGTEQVVRDVLADEPAAAPAQLLQLGPHRPGGGGRHADAVWRRPLRRLLRLRADQPRPGPGAEAGVRALPGRRLGIDVDAQQALTGALTERP